MVRFDALDVMCNVGRVFIWHVYDHPVGWLVGWG